MHAFIEKPTGAQAMMRAERQTIRTLAAVAIALVTCVHSLTGGQRRVAEGAARYHHACGCRLIYLNSLELPGDVHFTVPEFSGGTVETGVAGDDLPLGSTAHDRITVYQRDWATLTIPEEELCRIAGRYCRVTGFYDTEPGEHFNITTIIYPTGGEAVVTPPVLFTGKPEWANFEVHLDLSEYPRNLLDSVQVAVTSPLDQHSLQPKPVSIDEIAVCAYCDGTLWAAFPALWLIAPYDGTLSPVFQSEITDYVLEVPEGVTGTAVTLWLEHAYDANDVEVTLNGSPARLGTPIPVDFAESPAIHVRVKSLLEPCLASDYIIRVQERVVRDATLLSLAPSAGTLAPNFQRFGYDYDLLLGPRTPSYTLTPTSYDPRSSVTVNGVPVERGKASEPLPAENGDAAQVVVTAFDGTVSRTYTVAVAKYWIGFRSPSAMAREDAGTVDIPVVLSSLPADATTTMTVEYTTLPAPASTAEPDVDYSPVSGTLTWGPCNAPPCELEQTIHVPVLDDGVTDDNGYVITELSTPSGAVLDPDNSQHRLNIIDANHIHTVSLATSTGSGVERDEAYEVTIRLDSDPPPDIPGERFSVRYHVSGGTATEGVDFRVWGVPEGDSGTVVWEYGESQTARHEIVLQILPDEVSPEAHETIEISLCRGAGGAVVGSPSTYIFEICEPVYVKWDAAGANNGRSWADAFIDLQDGLAYAREHPEVREIWVAKGSYKPAQAGQRNVAFEMVDGVNMYGGFAGTESVRHARDAATNETVLDGDLNGDDDDTYALTDEQCGNVENARHVVRAEYLSSGRLDGFTVQGGHADDYYDWTGAGLYCLESDLTVQACMFTRNYADYFDEMDLWDGCGGGLGVEGGVVHVTNCTFVDNAAARDGGGFYQYEGELDMAGCAFLGNSTDEGGAVCITDATASVSECDFGENMATGYGAGLFSACELELQRCSFTGNSVSAYGGGIYLTSPWNQEAMVQVTECIFESNTAGLRGGGVYLLADTAAIVRSKITSNSAEVMGGGLHIANAQAAYLVSNCLFADNYATREGGAVGMQWGRLWLVNSTLAGNIADEGGYAFAMAPWKSSSQATVSNCIVYSQGDLVSGHAGDGLRFAYSNVRGSGGSANWDTSLGKNLGGNIDDDPSWFGEDDYHLSASSRCIDMADDAASLAPTTDIEGRTRIDIPGVGNPGTVSDMGAYEYVP